MNIEEEKKQLLEDTLEYLGKDFEWFQNYEPVCRLNRRKQWDDQDPKTADEIMRYYETSGKEDFIVNLCSFNRRETLHFPPQAWFPNAKTFMDFGCGLGTVAMHMANLGLEVWMCDLDTEAFKFAKWRFEKHGIDVHDAVIDSVLPKLGKGMFDGIACVDVIEHVVNPVELVWRFHQALKPGGTLYITNVTAWHDDVHNWHLIAQPPMFRELIFKMGFKAGANNSLYVRSN